MRGRLADGGRRGAGLLGFGKYSGGELLEGRGLFGCLGFALISLVVLFWGGGFAGMCMIPRSRNWENFSIVNGWMDGCFVCFVRKLGDGCSLDVRY